ncbi:MAG: membrane lipoprotein lipid attachment site-containing protein [Candidatus Cloacimonetes bacterium]|nr:membrane lipoprotein lipid attachment site-containing protein [Candidatus Cloacimonadota bacterium]
MKRIILLILTLFALAGCVNYDEELWLNRDGSGRARLRLVHRSPYENPEEIVRKAALPGISLHGYDIQRRGADAIYTIDFKFKNVEAFNNVNDQLSAADFWGKITLNKEPGRRITFKRRISLGSQESDDDFENIFSKMQTDSLVWRYKLHVPWKIVSSNAAPENIDTKNRTISWSFDTRSMWNKTELMTVELKKDFPWILVVVGAIVFILAVFLVHWLFRFARKSHLIERLKHHEDKIEN